MKNPLITEDCYVDVKDWSEEDVQRAAEIFSGSLGLPIGNLKRFNNYHYLTWVPDQSEEIIFVEKMYTLEKYDRTKELTKDQVFNPEKYVDDTQETANDTQEMTPNYYCKMYKGIKLDPYRIAWIYNIDGGAKEQILKKVLRGTSKGHEELQVIKEIRQALDRWEEMVNEDMDNTNDT